VAASAAFYNNWLKASQSGANLNGATLKATLHSSTYTPNVSTHAVYADLTNELATANGYSSGGATLSGVTFTLGASSSILTASPTVWSASGGSIVARYVVLRYVGTVNGQVDPLIEYVLVDTDGGGTDKTATAGNSFTVTWSGSGIYVASR
jgi:hypothetical protein